MSDRRPGTGSQTDDLVGAPFIDDAERAESEWLIAREREPGASPPSPKIARDHAELGDLLAHLPLGPSEDSWHDEVLRQALSSATPWRPWWRRRAVRWGTAAAATLAAAAVAVLMLRPRPRAEELEIAIIHGEPSRDDSRQTAVGDRLIVKAHPGGASELRVYRADGPLVARCPDGPGCTTGARDEHAVEVTLDTPVPYHVILVVGASASLPDGSMDTYLDAARAANARIVTRQPIEVR
jgi:hypothetical protein